MSLPLRIAQLTDLHWLAEPSGRFHGVDPRASFQTVLAAAVAEAPDLWLVTGDLAHEPGTDLYETLAGRLLRPGGVVHAVPGNHDAPGLMAEIMQAAGVRLDSLVLGDWRLVLLDSCVPGQVGGRLGPAALNRLEAELAEAPEPFLAIVLHHPPIPVGTPWLDATRLEDGDALLTLLSRYPGVRLVLVGHVHQAVDRSIDGVRVLSAPSTAIQFEPGSPEFTLTSEPPGYRWLRLHQDGGVETGVVRVNSPNP